MIERTFYHNTTRRYTVAFGSIFNGITIERENKAGDVVGTIPIPLIYSNKEKFVRRAMALNSMSDDETKIKETLPAMGFELRDMVYSPTRKTNTMERIVNDRETRGKFMFNRVPYDFTFSVYIAARRIDDALRIVEQILPYFTPELNLRIKEMKDFPDIISDIPVVLVDAGGMDESGDSFDDRRVIQWEMTFMLKGHLYTNVRDVDLIKQSIVELSDSDINSFYEGYMSQVDPLNAGTEDELSVNEQITSEEHDGQAINGYNNVDVQATME